MQFAPTDHKQLAVSLSLNELKVCTCSNSFFEGSSADVKKGGLFEGGFFYLFLQTNPATSTSDIGKYHILSI